MSSRSVPSASIFWACAATALALHALLLLSSPQLSGGADLVPHLRLIQLMSEQPGLHSVYAPAYHVLGAVLAPLVGLANYPKVFAVASVAAWIAGFRFFQRAAGLPDASAALFVLLPYGFCFSWCLPRVEAAGYALAFFGLGLLLRRRYVALAIALVATFLVHTAAALFFGIAAGVLALARLDGRGLLALAAGTLSVAPLFAAHLAAGCSPAEALLFSPNDYLRVTARWSSAAVWDVIVLLANPIAVGLAVLGARAVWRSSRPVAVLCAALVLIYLNELWLARLETRTSLDLLRGLSVLAFPVAVAGGLALSARPRAAPWLLAICAVWALVAALLVVPRSCYVREIRVAELRQLQVARCTFRWKGPALRRPRAPGRPGAQAPAEPSPREAAGPNPLRRSFRVPGPAVIRAGGSRTGCADTAGRPSCGA